MIMTREDFIELFERMKVSDFGHYFDEIEETGITSSDAITECYVDGMSNDDAYDALASYFESMID